MHQDIIFPKFVGRFSDRQNVEEQEDNQAETGYPVQNIGQTSGEESIPTTNLAGYPIFHRALKATIWFEHVCRPLQTDVNRKQPRNAHPRGSYR